MRWRFLPIAMFAAVLMLGVKIGNFLFGLDSGGVSPSYAQQANEPTAQAKDNRPSQPPKSENVKNAPKSESGGAAKTAENTETNSGKNPPPKKGDLPSDPTLFTQAEVDLLQKLANRRAKLERWSQDLVMREQLLKATEQRIEKKMVELAAIQRKVKSMLKSYDQEQESRLKSLVKIYESMKPKDAARIFMELDMPVLLDVVERMREAKAAPIIAKLEPQRAKRVTAKIVVRRKFRGDRAGVNRSASAKPDALPSAAN